MRVYARGHRAVGIVAVFLFFLFLGVILLGFGALTLASLRGDYEKTTAVIEEINPLEEGEMQVIVSYTVDGTEYRGELDYYSSDLMMGDEIKIKYAADDPTNIHAVSGSIIGYILLAAGALALIFAVRTLVKGFSSMREDKKQEESFREKTKDIPTADLIFPTDEEGELYYFHYDKSVTKQGHVMENKDKQVVYEGTIRAFKVVSDFEMDFINHITCHTETHFIGHTVTSEINDFTVNSTFNYDGEDVWKYLRKKGIRMDTRLTRHLTGADYDITLEGRPFAHISSSGVNIYGEEKKGFGKIADLSAPGYFRIYSFTDNLDLLFLVGVALARSETTVHD